MSLKDLFEFVPIGLADSTGVYPARPVKLRSTVHEVNLFNWGLWERCVDPAIGALWNVYPIECLPR